jgi:gas vesicle protein
MESSSRYESGYLSAFFTFITGALVGAGVALLFSPQAGSRTRRLLRNYAARAKDEFDDAVDRGGEAWDQATERGQEFVEKGKESLRETARQAKGFVAAGRTTVNNAKDELASRQR